MHHIMTIDDETHIKNDEKTEDLRAHLMSQGKLASISNTNNAIKKGGKTSEYKDCSKKELMEKAKKFGIEERSIMDKYQLRKALRRLT
ncbi:MAG: Rho termination factor [Aquaticitalea sp.]